MVPVVKLLASMPFHKNFHRSILIAVITVSFVALLQIHYNGGPQRLRPVKQTPYDVTTMEDDDEPRTMVTSSAFRPVAFPAGKGRTKTPLKELCAGFPRHLLASIQPVLKTGFTDNPERMKAQMESCSACFQPGDLLIFSDLDSTYEGHEIIDILATLPKSYHDYEQFKPYFEQKRLRDSGAVSQDPAALKAIDGWKLDKFKFLPQVEMAWQMRPNRDFYVFYETDTYIFWDPLLRLLDTVDPDTPLYMGSATPGRRDEFGRNTRFANGGPGYVLSRAAVKRLLHRRASPAGVYLDPPFAEKHHGLLHDFECCGDSVLGFAAWKSGIQMSALYPMFSQHALQNLPFDAMRWCSPLLTMHRPHFDDMRTIFEWEFETRSNDHAMRHCDLWDLQKPGTESRRDNWRNDDERDSRRVEGKDAGTIDTEEKCEAHCQSLSECLMWTWRGHEHADCLVTEGIVRAGEAAAAETTTDGRVNYTAGWMTQRVAEWRSTHECNDTLWLGHSFSRMF